MTQPGSVTQVIDEMRRRLETFGNRLTDVIARFESHMKACDDRYDHMAELNEERHNDNRVLLKWILGVVFSLLVALVGILLTVIFAHVKFG